MGVARVRRNALARAAALGVVLSLAPNTAPAETLLDALSYAYESNPQLNGERARLRGTDENVPQALAGYRPQVSGAASGGVLASKSISNPNAADQSGNSIGPGSSSTLYQQSYGVTVTQPVFDGFKTPNAVKQAEAQVRSGRESVRNVGQTVLLSAATAYMDVLQNQALVEVQQFNVATLGQTLEITRRRYEVGDVTPTDVAQAEARLSRGLADLNTAETALAVSRANYAQVIGMEPRRLTPAAPPEALLPRTREAALDIGRRENPAVVGAGFDVDTAQYSVKTAEAAFLPTFNIQGSLQRNYNPDVNTGRTDTASLMGVLNVPIYSGGQDSSKVRQAKAALAQSRTALDLARVQTRAGVLNGWANFEAARVALTAATAEVRAAEIALAGVRNEARAGQRTILDVLNQLQEVVNARSRLIQAQHDRVVSGYALLAAIGRLEPKWLGLRVREYRPEINYEIVRDKWGGLRTPAGE